MDTDRDGEIARHGPEPADVLPGLYAALRSPDVPVALSPLLMAAAQVIKRLAALTQKGAPDAE